MIYPMIHFPCKLLERWNSLETCAIDIDAIKNIIINYRTYKWLGGPWPSWPTLLSRPWHIHMYNTYIRTYTHRAQQMSRFTNTLVFSCVHLIKLVGWFWAHKQHTPIMYLRIAHVYSLMCSKCSLANHVMPFVSMHSN